MRNFLYVMVGTVPVLLDSDAVHEVIPLPKDNGREDSMGLCAAGHMNWRDQLLAVVTMREMLELPLATNSSDKVGVVYRFSLDHPPIFFVVDKILRILKLGLDAFVPLLIVPDKLSRYFDKVYIDSDEYRQVYCLRNPFSCCFLG